MSVAVGNLRDRPRAYATVPTTSATDLLQTQNGWLWRSRVQAGSVRVDRSIDGGVTWTLLSSVSSNTAALSAPTLARDRWDNVLAWWHNGSGLVRAYSEDYGQTWTVGTAGTGLRYPRMVVDVTGTAYLVAWGGDKLRLYSGDPLGSSLVQVQEWGAPEQLASLELDAWQNIHLVYVDALPTGAILHRFSADAGASLSTTTTLVASGASYPSFAIPESLLEYALLVYRASGVLTVARLNETYRGGLTAVAAPAVSYSGGYLGTLIDADARAWISHPAAGGQTARQSRSLTSWAAPS